VNNIEYAKHEESKVELHSIQQLILKIVIVFECLALCFIVAALIYILLPGKELPASSQEFSAEEYIYPEVIEQGPKFNEEQVENRLRKEETQASSTVKQEKENDKPFKETEEDKQGIGEQKVAGAFYPGNDSGTDTDFDSKSSITSKGNNKSSETGDEPGLDSDEPGLDSDYEPKSNAGSKSDINLESKSDIDLDLDKPMIALTFDDGPHKAVTNRILDILEQHNAKATFFVLGLQVETHAETLQRIHSLGCQIGNHSYNHKYLHSLSSEEILKEIEDTNSLIREIIGIEASIVRPPYGAPNDYLKELIPHPLVLWSVDPKDWNNFDKEAIINEVLGKVKDGDIVILHDTYPTTADACEIIIPKLIEEGYQLVTVEELMRARNITMMPGNAYYNARRK